MTSDIELSPADRAELERRMHSRLSGPRERIRAWAILLAAEGLTNIEIERRSGLGREHVARWRRQYVQLGLPGLEELPRSGRPRTFGADVRQVLSRLAASVPPLGNRWTLRALADAVVGQLGVSISRSQIRRILIEMGMHPVRSE